MLPKTLVERLVAHQEAILAILARAEACLRDAGQRDALTLGKLRWEMTRIIGGYTLFKHGELFDPLIAHGTAEQVRTAAQAKQACQAFGDRFHEHVRKWSSTDVLEHWAEYQPTTLALMAQLRVHIGSERRIVVAMLASDPKVLRVPRGRNLDRAQLSR